MNRECLCGATTDTNWSSVCGGCGRYYHGQEERDGVQRTIWGVRPPAAQRPRGDNLINAGWLIAIGGAALYFAGYALPATITIEPSSFDRLVHDALPTVEVNPWRLVAFAVGAGLFGLGPLVWATGQIVRAIWWLQQEPEPPIPVKRVNSMPAQTEVSVEQP